MRGKVIHLGHAGAGSLWCHAKPVGKYPADMESNWTWKAELATCKRCLSAKRNNDHRGK